MPGRELALEHHDAALPQHDDDPAEAGEGDYSEEDSPYPRPPECVLYDLGNPVAVACSFEGFLDEALHRPDLAEHLLGLAASGGDLVLYRRADAAQPAAEQQGGPDHDGDHRQGRERQPGLQEDEYGYSTNQAQDLAREFGDLMAEDALQQPDIGRQPADQLAGLVLGKIARRHVEQPGEELVAESADGPLAGGAE